MYLSTYPPFPFVSSLSDVSVLGAVNPSTSALVWRQELNTTANHAPRGFTRAAEGEGWVASALGAAVYAWDAVGGRNRFWVAFKGEVRDLEVMEMTEAEGRKDLLALFEEAGGEVVVRRLSGKDGSVVWEHRDAKRDVPLQLSTSVEKVFAVGLKGIMAGGYSIRVAVLDTLTGKRRDEIVLGTKGEVRGEGDVMFVGAGHQMTPYLGEMGLLCCRK